MHAASGSIIAALISVQFRSLGHCSTPFLRNMLMYLSIPQNPRILNRKPLNSPKRQLASSLGLDVDSVSSALGPEVPELPRQVGCRGFRAWVQGLGFEDQGLGCRGLGNLGFGGVRA